MSDRDLIARYTSSVDPILTFLYCWRNRVHNNRLCILPGDFGLAVELPEIGASLCCFLLDDAYDPL